MKYLIATLALPIALLLSVASPAACMQTDGGTRSVEGKVYNSTGKIVVGAVVQIKDLKSLQIRSFITESGGGYRFLGLSTESEYELSATYAGVSSKPRMLTVFNSHKRVVLDLKLK